MEGDLMKWHQEAIQKTQQEERRKNKRRKEKSKTRQRGTRNRRRSKITVGNKRWMRCTFYHGWEIRTRGRKETDNIIATSITAGLQDGFCRSPKWRKDPKLLQLSLEGALVGGERREIFYSDTRKR